MALQRRPGLFLPKRRGFALAGRVDLPSFFTSMRSRTAIMARTVIGAYEAVHLTPCSVMFGLFSWLWRYGRSELSQAGAEPHLWNIAAEVLL